MEKYFNEAIIGNTKVTASLSKKGEILRIFYPYVDYKQFIDFYHIGLKINDSGIVYLHDDINNVYNQYYEKSTNILITEIFNTYFNLKIEQTDFACVKENVIVRKYKFTNESTIELNLKFLVHAGLISTDNNQISGFCKNDVLMQYMHDYTICTFSKNKIESSQINDAKANIEEAKIGDKDYIGMSKDSSISYNLENIKPNETKEFELYIYVDDNNSGLSGMEKTIERIRKIDFRVELDNARKYWRKYLKNHDGLKLDLMDTPRNNKIKEIYERTILLYPFLTNSETGGISAAVEVDEKLTTCGRYSYCWTRDAIFVAKAMDDLNMRKRSRKIL